MPVLDGGQIAILAVEGLFRRDMSMQVKERILLVGAALIVLLMVTVIYNDVARLCGSGSQVGSSTSSMGTNRDRERL